MSKIFNNGQPWTQQYDLNATQNTDVTGWVADANLPGVLQLSQAVVTKDRVYLLGGENAGGCTAVVYTCPINGDGTLGTWTTGTSLPGALSCSQAIVTDNRVYLLGGSDGPNNVNTVYTAQINTDGTLGTWATGTSLPGALAYSQVVVTEDRVYLLGGFDGSNNAAATVYTAPINSDGTLGAWTTGTSLPGVISQSALAKTKDRVYLMGGWTGAVDDIVYTAPINTDGTLGAWTTDTNLPGTVRSHMKVVTEGMVYLFGGSSSSTVYICPINTDGTLGAWTTGTSIPATLRYSQPVITSSKIYLLGGYAVNVDDIVYEASFGGGFNDYLDKSYTIPPGSPIKSFIDMPYGAVIGENRAFVQMPYALLFPHTAFIDMRYSLRLGARIAMPYGNCPQRQAILDQYYGDCPTLRRVLDMPYDSLLALKHVINMSYSLLAGIRAAVDMPYTLAGEPLRSVLSLPYGLLENNQLRVGLDMPYMLQSESFVTQVATSLTIAGNAIACKHINIECNRANFMITGEAHIASLEQFLTIKKGDAVEAVCNETTFVLIVSAHPKRSRPGGAVTNFVVEFGSPVVQRTAPWSQPLQLAFASAPAESIINDLLDDFAPCDYLTTPFPVLSDTLYANDEDARTVIRKLTQSVGAVMQSNPDGSIRIEPEYPKGWNSDTPIDYFLTDERNFISQDETPVSNSGENKYLVGNMLSSDEKTWPEQRTINDTTVEVMGFQVPWGSKEIHGLTHSGGDWIHAPEYLGVVEELYPPADEPAERIEFKAGFATASKPIYGDLQIDWLRQSLGSITYAEDGKLEAELKTGSTEGYGLCDIRYLTKYHLWRVRDEVAEDVQYILWVEE